MANRRVLPVEGQAYGCVMTKQMNETVLPARILGDSYDMAVGLRRLLAGAKQAEAQIMSVASLQSTVRDRLASQVVPDVHHRARWRPRRHSAIV
jgi:hypothetical protein